MNLFEAFVLGIVQGITEFLPISSSAHLRVVPALLGWPDPGAAFSAVIQLGSVVAVISYFWKDLMELVSGSFQAVKAKNYADHNLRVVAGILIGTLPICVLGLLFKHLLEDPNGPVRSLYVIGGAAIFMGLLLAVAEKIGKRARNMQSLSANDGLLVGLGQCMALIPGCSRSGSTLTVALFLNLKREDGARFSFLLGIPAITLAGLLELKDLLHGISQDGISSLIVGLLTSLVVSYLSIAWLLKYLQKHSTWLFVVYRLLFGTGIILLVSMHLIR